MANLYIAETMVNATKGHIFGESGPVETFTDDRGELYRSLTREYGRCVSKVYCDTKNGKPVTTGWVFQKRMDYEDARNSWPKEDHSYLREVWVSVIERPATDEAE